MKVEVRHTANIISIVEVINNEVVNVFKTWHEADFTERKLNNYLKKHGMKIWKAVKHYDKHKLS